MMRIYLTNLGKYNEGELIGKWVELPISDEELEATLEEIGIDGERYQETFITDYETDINGLKIGEYDGIEELNELTEVIEANDPEAVEALIYFGYDTAEEIADYIDDILFFEGSDDYDIGYYYAIECGCLDIPDNIQNYFDFEAYGRDIELEGNFYFANNGYIYELCR